MATVYKTILSSPFGTLYGGQASALTGTVYDSTGAALTLYDSSGNSLGTTVFSHTEIGTNTGNYQATIYLPTTQAGVATYTWTGTPAIATLGTDVVAPGAVDPVAVGNALLTAAISPTVRPTIGTVGEALAAARAAAIGNKTANPTTGVVVVKASDDTTTFSTLTLSPSIAAPTTEVRS